MAKASVSIRKVTTTKRTTVKIPKSATKTKSTLIGTGKRGNSNKCPVCGKFMRNGSHG